MTSPAPADYRSLPDLASRRLGGSVISANDELFAEKENLITPQAPGFRPHTFGHRGQVYDGWETRRRRTPGDDHAIVRLGVPGVVRGVVVDTAFFTGNYPPEISVAGTGVEGHVDPGADAEWTPLVPRTPAGGDQENTYPVAEEQRFTHVRLSIYPDGGVARLRVHGRPVPDPRLLDAGVVDLLALENGGEVLDCSNRFYSAPTNLISPGLASSMGDGWETARRRDDGNDWVHFGLAAPGVVRLLELDTSHFLGNAPGAAEVSGLGSDGQWRPMLLRTPLLRDTRHRFPLPVGPPVSQLRLDIFPDGGMARVRAYGALTAEGRAAVGLRWFDLLPAAAAEQVLTGSLGLPEAGAREIIGQRPFRAAGAVPDVVRPMILGG
ncbi:MAG: allantoicase [Geodermatophilaceae bacterium]|nr:allantoicase [Geodermatophilaceae bacterium]